MFSFIGLVSRFELRDGAHSLGFVLGWRRPPIFTAHARGDQSGKVDHAVFFALLGCQISCVKTVEDGVSHEQHEPQDDDAIRVMMVVVVGMPVGHQLVEAFVLDLPAIMP